MEQNAGSNWSSGVGLLGVFLDAGPSVCSSSDGEVSFISAESCEGVSGFMGVSAGGGVFGATEEDGVGLVGGDCML